MVQQGVLKSSLLKKIKVHLLTEGMVSVNSTKEPCGTDYCLRSSPCGDSRFVVNHGAAGHGKEPQSSFKASRTPTDDTTELLSRLKTDGATWGNVQVAALFPAPGLRSLAQGNRHRGSLIPHTRSLSFSDDT